MGAEFRAWPLTFRVRSGGSRSAGVYFITLCPTPPRQRHGDPFHVQVYTPRYGNLGPLSLAVQLTANDRIPGLSTGRVEVKDPLDS